MRTVAALYDNRTEAEFARSRLVSRLKARSPRIIAKDTVAAVDDLDISPEAAKSYRDGLREGAHLLVIQVPSSARPERIVELLEEAIGHGVDRDSAQQWGDSDGVRVELPEEPTPAKARQSAFATSSAQSESAAAAPPVEERAPPLADAPLGRGNLDFAPGARVRAFTRDAPAEERVSLNEEQIEVENRSAERPVSDADLEAGELFKERTFEIAEMREEPVVTKVAVVREEVIVRKKVNQRSETIRDTVRQTAVEVEDLPDPDRSEPTFFGAARGEPPARR